MRSQKALDQEETLSIYSKGFVVDGTFIDFIGAKPIDMDEEKVKIFLAQVNKKLEELNKQHHTQQ
jgi:hypothetical protein